MKSVLLLDKINLRVRASTNENEYDIGLFLNYLA